MAHTFRLTPGANEGASTYDVGYCAADTGVDFVENERRRGTAVRQHDLQRQQETRMAFWKQNVDQIISSNGFPVLMHAGKVSHTQMERATSALYLDYDQRRKQEEAHQADAQDDAELKALENSLKKRPKP